MENSLKKQLESKILDHFDVIQEIIQNISKVKFYNLSFRCYRGIYKDYVVGIHPFVTDIFEIKKLPGKIGAGGNFEYLDFDNNIIEIFRVHYQDYRENPETYWFDPCLFYEDIIGDKIHTDSQNGDRHKFGLSKEFYIEQRRLFDNSIYKLFRKLKLSKISNLNGKFIKETT
jgi:hypothetical protein